MPLTGRDIEEGCKTSYLLSMFDCSAEPQHRMYAKGLFRSRMATKEALLLRFMYNLGALGASVSPRQNCRTACLNTCLFHMQVPIPWGVCSLMALL